MFETMNDVPQPISSFYHEVVRNEPLLDENDEQVFGQEEYTYVDENGDTVTTYRPVAQYHDVTYVELIPFGETQDNVNTLMLRKAPEERVLMFVGFVNNGIDKTFHDAYLAWYLMEPTIEEHPDTYDEDGERVDNLTLATELWQTQEPVSEGHKAVIDFSEYTKWRKLLGIQFEGVACSATKEDMWGLNSVETTVRAGHAVNFNFDSGETLVLTQDNIDDFQAVWVPFRMSFFS